MMICCISRVEQGGNVQTNMFFWKESVIPTKAQMIQKSIQYLVSKKAESGKYVVDYDDYSLTFDFVKR